MNVSVKRVERYLAARKKLRQLDQAWIHWINEGDKSEAELRTEDITSLLEQRAQLLEALKKIAKGDLYNATGMKEWIAELTAIACGKRSKEDQALWDKVAIAVIGGVVSSDAFHNYPNFQGNPEVGAEFAAQMADAFMAERAKRLDNSHTTNSTNTDSPLKSSRVVL